MTTLRSIGARRGSPSKPHYSERQLRASLCLREDDGSAFPANAGPLSFTSVTFACPRAANRVYCSANECEKSSFRYPGQGGQAAGRLSRGRLSALPPGVVPNSFVLHSCSRGWRLTVL